MKIYTVYTNQTAEKPVETAVFVPEGFSLLALIFPFNFIWAIMNKSWLFLVILLVYFFSSIPISFAGDDVYFFATMVKLALFPFLGVWCYDLWRNSLENRGFTMQAVVSGKNESEAQLRYFETLK